MMSRNILPAPAALGAVASLLLSALAPGCKADDPRSKVPVDAAPTVTQVDPPELDPLPERTPNTSVPVQGTSTSSRVVIQGSPDGTLLTTVLLGNPGSFCQDVDLNPDGPTDLLVYSIEGSQISTAAAATVTYDPGAPPPPGDKDCSGVVNPACQDEEVCGSDGKDEDCNGFADECDIACNGCTDDLFEPNDVPINVPEAPPGSTNLQICPCRDDWFAFNVGMGDRVHAIITFNGDVTQGGIDLDLKLFRVGANGTGTDGDALQTSAGTDGTEEIDWTADMPGTYLLHVYPFSAADKPSGPYTLTVD